MDRSKARIETSGTEANLPQRTGEPGFEARELLDVADLQQGSSNFESAVQTYRQALESAERAPDLAEIARQALRARALKGVGSCLERMGRWREAQNVLGDASAAARLAGDEPELGRIEIKLGKIHLGQGDIDSAVQSGRRALELLPESEDMSSRGFALNLLGSAYNRAGDLDASATCFEQALGAFKRAGDIRSLALAYNNLGLIYKERCDWSRALEYLQVASSLQAIEGDYPQRRAGLHNLGLVHFRIGNLERAETCFREAQELSRTVNDPLGVIRALLGAAGVHLVQRNWKSALESLEQVLELCSEEQYPRETALTYRSLGQLHQARGELNRARRCYEVAWRKAVEIAQEGDLARELLRLRAELAVAQDRLDEALSLARRAEALSAAHGDAMETAQARTTLGRVLVLMGDASGFAQIELGLKSLRSLGSPLPLVQSLVAEARMRLDAGDDYVRAETVLREASDVIRPLGLQDLLFEILLLLAETTAAVGDLDRATDALDQARRLAGERRDPALNARFEKAQKDLEARLVESSVSHLGAYRTAGRLEEIVESQRPASAKLADVLEILASALEADGAAFVSADPSFPVTTHRIGTATAKLLGQVLAKTRVERPELILNAATSTRRPWTDLAEARQATSLMVVPLYRQGQGVYLYVDRLAGGHRSAFGPSHLQLCLALGAQIAVLLDRIAGERDETAPDDSPTRRIYLADVVTQNAEMVRILKLVEKVSHTDLTVLLQGETGTGKTLIARAIHLTSNRASGPFVTVDCAALPENLLESELFGYMKGAFTGASGDKKGLFEEADGGTIFLDEISKAGLGVQRRLLHLLDRGEVRPVGATHYRKLNVRVICASSKQNLLDDEPNVPFIKDLFYRLNDIIIRVPSLRDRPEDIPLLAEYFLEIFRAQTEGTAAAFSRAAMQRLVRYDWPGNVRELEKAVRRAAILAEEGETIGVDLLPVEVVSGTEVASAGAKDAGLRGTVEDMERKMVVDALDRCDWNKTRAAAFLGLSRKGLKNKISRYGITPRRGA